MSDPDNISRRPLRSRDTKWAHTIASLLARSGVRPNVISIAGTLFAAAAGLCFWFAGRTGHIFFWSILLLSATAGMQLRLLCNLFDGMVAIEGGFKTRSGELFNELPDRFSDAFVLIGAGYSLPGTAWTSELGWAAAVLAVITAYVRALGANMGAGQHFIGPMAKQQRMAVLTVACLIACPAPIWPPLAKTIPVALGVVVAGCVITIFRRCVRIAYEMERKP